MNFFRDCWHHYMGESWFAQPVPDEITPDMLFTPDTPFRAGETIKARSVDRPGQTPWANVGGWNVPYFVVDSSLPEGPWATGGGGYKMGRWWQRYESTALWRRPDSKCHQMGTLNIPMPLDPDFGPTLGGSNTDLSCAIIDVNPANPRIWEGWIVRKQTADTNYRAVTLATSSDNGGHDSGERIPTGEWTYRTVGYTQNFRHKPHHDYGSDTASACFGSLLALGIDEMIAWAGVKREPDGSFSSIAPRIDSCQHVIGLELPTDIVPGGFYPPAAFTDGEGANTTGLAYGQRIVLDRATADAIIADPAEPSWRKGLVWTLSRYGFMATDRSGTTAIRLEEWYPSMGGSNPWVYTIRDRMGLSTNYGKPGGPLYPDYASFMKAVPWGKLMALKGGLALPSPVGSK